MINFVLELYNNVIRALLHIIFLIIHLNNTKRKTKLREFSILCDFQNTPENSTLGASRLRKIDFSGNRFGPIPEGLFDNVFSVEEIRWEKDTCDGSRVLPEALLVQNKNLTKFLYSINNSSSCSKLELPSELFPVNDSRLSTLKLTNCGLNWTDVKKVLLPLKQNLQLLDLSGNEIIKVNLTDLPSTDSFRLNLINNKNLSCE